MVGYAVLLVFGFGVFFSIKVDPVVLTVLKLKHLVGFVLFLTEISARLSSLHKFQTIFPENRMVLFGLFSNSHVPDEHEGGKISGH